MNDQPPIEQYLVITAIGSDRPGIVNDLAKVCVEYQSNIIDSRMTVLGGEFAVIMMIDCQPQKQQSLQSAISATSEKLGLTTVIKTTTPRAEVETISYSVTVVALDNPGIVKDIAGFFSERSINIEDMQTGTYSAPHTGTQMFSLKMVVNIPTGTRLAELKDNFFDFCDDRNLDTTIEATKS
ncbi:MAG: glycine cleavage system protein R [Gammaproteobacteria bacterium]|nr:MAG: glycine cleavage system protein R [Gammaproteobacteria bacterium]